MTAYEITIAKNVELAAERARIDEVLQQFEPDEAAALTAYFNGRPIAEVTAAVSRMRRARGLYTPSETLLTQLVERFYDTHDATFRQAA